MPTIAQIVDIEDQNQHGAIPNGYMHQSASGTWIALDPINGNWLFNITGVPSGTMSYGAHGELLIDTLNANAKTLQYGIPLPESTSRPHPWLRGDPSAA